MVASAPASAAAPVGSPADPGAAPAHRGLHRRHRHRSIPTASTPCWRAQAHPSHMLAYANPPPMVPSPNGSPRQPLSMNGPQPQPSTPRPRSDAVVFIDKVTPWQTWLDTLYPASGNSDDDAGQRLPCPREPEGAGPGEPPEVMVRCQENRSVVVRFADRYFPDQSGVGFRRRRPGKRSARAHRQRGAVGVGRGPHPLPGGADG